MSTLAIIGGSGLTALEGLEITRQKIQLTPYGEPSGELTYGKFAGKEIIFLPRHGNPHTIPPHKVNYRANIWALKENNVDNIISINAVGGITKDMYPARLVIPDQIIDYTYSRENTFFEEKQGSVTHIDFTEPYSRELRQLLIESAKSNNLDVCSTGVYAATQGPRLETAAEIERLERDGCDIVGMTGMPEAALAKELAIPYASIAMVVNWAAGKSDEAITMEMIEENLKNTLEKVQILLTAVIPKI